MVAPNAHRDNHRATQFRKHESDSDVRRARPACADLLWDLADQSPPSPPTAADTAPALWYADPSPTGDDRMTPTLTAPDPTVFPADVLTFSADRGVTDHLVPLYDLAARCFPGADIAVLLEDDAEIPGLRWIVYEVAASQWPDAPRRAGRHRWVEEFGRATPPAVRECFVLGLR
jgi:hypothetical protein